MCCHPERDVTLQWSYPLLWWDWRYKALEPGILCPSGSGKWPVKSEIFPCQYGFAFWLFPAPELLPELKESENRLEVCREKQGYYDVHFRDLIILLHVGKKWQIFVPSPSQQKVLKIVMFRHWGPGSKKNPLVLTAVIDFKPGLLEPGKQKILEWICCFFLWYWLPCSHKKIYVESIKHLRLYMHMTLQRSRFSTKRSRDEDLPALSTTWGTNWKLLLFALLLLLLLLKAKYFCETSHSEFHCVLKMSPMFLTFIWVYLTKGNETEASNVLLICCLTKLLSPISSLETVLQFHNVKTHISSPTVWDLWIQIAENLCKLW